MSRDDRLQVIRKTGREAMPLRAGRGAGFHGDKAYDRGEEDDRWRRIVWQERDIEIEYSPPTGDGLNAGSTPALWESGEDDRPGTGTDGT